MSYYIHSTAEQLPIIQGSKVYVNFNLVIPDFLTENWMLWFIRRKKPPSIFSDVLSETGMWFHTTKLSTIVFEMLTLLERFLYPIFLLIYR